VDTVLNKHIYTSIVFNLSGTSLHSNPIPSIQTTNQYIVIMSSSNTTQNTSGNEDYADKGLDTVEKKYGGSMGQDTQKNRAVNEKIVSFDEGLVFEAVG
jgi:hypothetical protein